MGRDNGAKLNELFLAVNELSPRHGRDRRFAAPSRLERLVLGASSVWQARDRAPSEGKVQGSRFYRLSAVAIALGCAACSEPRGVDTTDLRAWFPEQAVRIEGGARFVEVAGHFAVPNTDAASLRLALPGRGEAAAA